MHPSHNQHWWSTTSSPFLLPCLTLLFWLVFLQQAKIGSSALIITLRNNNNKNHQQNKRPMFRANHSGCSFFVGSWVLDDSYPLYQSSNCPVIDPQFNCQMYGRPDSGYLKYRWKPLNCELPRFNGVEFLMRLREKTVMFVGDSLGRNQWESLICMILTSVPSTSTQMRRGDPFSTFRFLEYGVTISYYKAPYLVDIDVVQGERVLKLDEISGNANAWQDVDILSFNTGHWWSHKGSIQGWDYMEAEGTYYKDMDRLVAMEKGLRTWAHWVDSNINPSTTRVFFQAISPTHYNPSEWNPESVTVETAALATVMKTTETKNCYGETSPILSGTTTYLGDGYPAQMRIVDDVLNKMNTPTYLLDITMLSQLRKDGHPSIYSGDLSPEQRANPERGADCSHWCLPGLPDTWNELFYTALFF